MSEETSVSKKRTLESDSDLSQDSSKRLKISNESYVKSHNYKNSIQYIHEIPNIQPIKFEMLAQEGQAHKPVFKFCLNINIEGQAVAFYSSGASKKQAKIIAALKAISHLIDLPSFFHPDEIEAYKYLISVESKVNNIDKSALEKFESSSFDVSVPVAETKICEIKSVNPVKNEAILKEITTESSKLEFDLKTKEISTRNSLTILNHLLPKKLYTENLVEESGQAHSKIFKFEIRVIRDELKQSKIQFYLDLENESSKIKDSPLFKNLGDEFIFYGIGSTKKIAKSRAAQHLLEVLFNIKLSNPEDDLALSEEHDEEIGIKFKDFADNLNDLINKKYRELVEQLSGDNEFNPNKFLNVYSGIVQSNGIDVSTAKLICITTGTKCIGGEYMSLLGSSLNDCHAEILSVRVLRKYLLIKLKEYISGDYKSDIFEMNDETNPPYRIKKNVNFHLFVSSAPCGDSRIFSINDNVSCESIDSHPNRKVRGLLRAKLESGVGTIPVNSHERLQTWDGVLLGERLKIMCCSDKVCKYNILGVQGALLSHLIKPVYFESVIIGALYNKEHLARALYGRAIESSSNLPDGFKVHKPILSSITNSLQRQTSKPATKSLIWSDILSQLEIINCKLGKKEDGSHSELCKYEMFKLWIEIVQLIKMGNFDLEIIKELTYDKAKSLAKNYQDAKFAFYKCLMDKNLGKWLTAPIEQNFFNL